MVINSNSQLASITIYLLAERIADRGANKKNEEEQREEDAITVSAISFKLVSGLNPHNCSEIATKFISTTPSTPSIRPFYLRSSSPLIHKRRQNDVSIVTQLTMDQLDNLARLSSRWKGMRMIIPSTSYPLLSIYVPNCHPSTKLLTLLLLYRSSSVLL